MNLGFKVSKVALLHLSVPPCFSSVPTSRWQSPVGEASCSNGPWDEIGPTWTIPDTLQVHTLNRICKVPFIVSGNLVTGPRGSGVDLSGELCVHHTGTVRRWVSGMTLPRLHSAVFLSVRPWLSLYFLPSLLISCFSILFSWYITIYPVFAFSFPLAPCFFVLSLEFSFSTPYYFACVSYSFNYLWLFWTCFIFLFFSNWIFLSLAFLWAHLVFAFTQHWPNLFFCPLTSSTNPRSHPDFLSPHVHMVSLLWLLQPWLCGSYFSKQGRRRSRQNGEAIHPVNHNLGLYRSALECPKFCIQTSVKIS